MRFLIVFLFCIAMQTLSAQKEANSTITDVTVFLNGAEVTRTVSTALSKGENTIEVKGLSAFVDPNSISLAGNSSCVIKSVKHQLDFVSETEKNEEITNLESEIKDLEFNLATRQKLKSVYMEEKSLLQSNRNIKGNNDILLAEDLKEMSAFFREHLTELEYQMLELDLEINELNKKLTNLRNELNLKRYTPRKYTSKVILVLISESNSSPNLNLSYIVNNASWYASYDVRTSEVNQPVELSYKANIAQNTGVEWKNVNLTLSTGNPMVNGSKPILQPWYISVYNAQATYGWYNQNKASQEKRKKEDSYEGDEVSSENLSYNAALGSASTFTQSIESLVTTEFQITVPYDIPNDGSTIEVEIQRSQLASEFAYYSTPPIDTDAYLLARLTDWTDLNLLPGEANVFYQGSFVGNSFLDPYSTEDTLDVSLGKDKNIIISREKVEEFCKTNSFGSNKKTNRAYKITVKNNKSTPVSIKVEDQVPVSQQNEVTVTVDELSGGSLNEKTGIITWNLELAPGESKELTLQFMVKYPKKIKLARL